MPQIEPFAGIRFDPARVGLLSDVVAPPYDVIDSSMRSNLAQRHRHNCVRLILPEGEDDARYQRAADAMRHWRRDGVLIDEPSPAIYAYHQAFSLGGSGVTRRGFLCRVRVTPFGDGHVHPHEQTHGGPKEDRLKLWRACRANMSPVFGLYPEDGADGAQTLLERAIAGVPPLEATDHLGVANRLWPVTDGETISAVRQAMAARPIYIADGHHRYETAVAYRDAVAAQHGGQLPLGHPAGSVLMMCVSMSDPGMVVLPTHRLVRGLPEMDADTLGRALSGCFETEPLGEGPGRAFSVWERVELEGDQGVMALYTAGDRHWTLCRVTGAGRAKMQELAPDRSAEWRGLGVSLLHRLALDGLIAPAVGAPDLPAPKYVRSIDEVVIGLERGDELGRDLTGQVAHGGRFNIAAIVMPATLEHIRLLARQGERMPAKSTYFYPKVLSGLVFNPLE